MVMQRMIAVMVVHVINLVLEKEEIRSSVQNHIGTYGLQVLQQFLDNTHAEEGYVCLKCGNLTVKDREDG